MDERRLGPVIGLGTYETFLDDESLATDVVKAALGAGTTVFDSSPMYGAAEASLGSALRDRRSQGVVATKIWAESIAEGRAQYEAQRRFFDRPTTTCATRPDQNSRCSVRMRRRIPG